MPRIVQRLVHCTGNDILANLLNGIPAELRSNIMATAVGAGADIMVIAAKRFAKRSERTGYLRASINRIVKQRKYEGTAVAIVGTLRAVTPPPGRRPTAAQKRGYTSATLYAHLVEFGHAAVTGGSLRPQYERVLVGIGKFSAKGNEYKRWKRGSVKTAAKGREIGFVPAKPFLRPAFITTQAKVLAAVTRGIGDGIEKVRNKLIKEGAHVA